MKSSVGSQSAAAGYVGAASVAHVAWPGEDDRETALLFVTEGGFDEDTCVILVGYFVLFDHIYPWRSLFPKFIILLNTFQYVPVQSFPYTNGLKITFGLLKRVSLHFCCHLRHF